MRIQPLSACALVAALTASAWFGAPAAEPPQSRVGYMIASQFTDDGGVLIGSAVFGSAVGAVVGSALGPGGVVAGAVVGGL